MKWSKQVGMSDIVFKMKVRLRKRDLEGLLDADTGLCACVVVYQPVFCCERCGRVDAGNARSRIIKKIKYVLEFER